jgi:hypothetical protein
MPDPMSTPASAAPPASVPPGPRGQAEAWLGAAQPWLQWWREAGAWGCGLMAVGLFCDTRQLRRTYLADLTRTTDAYLRSPAFLELLRHTLNPAIRSTTLPSSTRPR